MLSVLASRWPVLATRGILALLFGVAAVIWPGATVLTLVVLFGLYALAEGILCGILAFAKQPQQPRWLLGLEAVAGVVVGFYALTRPGITAVSMLAVLGIWALVAGALRIGQAIALRKQIDNEWMLAASGALTIVLGLIVLARPGAGLLAVAWLVGLVAIAFGAAELSLAWRLRSMPAATAAGPKLWSMRAGEVPEEAARRDRIER